ncbi:MAG: response regulator [Anaerolineales bacterium]|nr:response regulator [Anaerolineales bacterium]
MKHRTSILIIDEIPEDVRLLSEMLTHHGYEIRWAASGAQALQSVQANPPNLILSDMLILKMNGYEVCQHLKADEAARLIPVICISAFETPEEKESAFAAGAVDYINKPFLLPEVLARVETHVALQNLREQVETRNRQFEAEIMERQQAQIALAETRDQALAANQFKGYLLNKVSHEFRTPLGAILGYAELLEKNIYGPLNPAQAEAVHQIIDSVHYLANLVNELLDQAQLEKGQLRLKMKPFPIQKLVERFEPKMSILAQAKGLTFAVEVAGKFPALITGDEERLQQVVVNLVSNAIKFTAAGRVQVSFYYLDSTHWAIQVSDTGPGIPQEAFSYIFEPFRQLDNSHLNGSRGTGLGLAIVKQLVTLMNGQIILESKPGQGSTFKVLLPMLPCHRLPG